MCEVEIKDESSDEQSDGPSSSKRSCLLGNNLTTATTNGKHYPTTNANEDTPSLSINNVAATLDTLKLLKNGQFSTSVTKVSSSKTNGEYDSINNETISSETTKIFLDMQNKEHILRMEILQVQLETAKYNRDAAQINKMIAVRNLSVVTASNNISDGNGTEH